MLFKNRTMLDAYSSGGYRERYAMDHGTCEEFREKGCTFLKFVLPPDIFYPEADGLVYNVDKMKWEGRKSL